MNQEKEIKIKDAINSEMLQQIFSASLEKPGGELAPEFEWMGWRDGKFSIAALDANAEEWVRKNVPLISEFKVAAGYELSGKRFLESWLPAGIDTIKAEDLSTALKCQNGIPESGYVKFLDFHKSRDGFGSRVSIEMDNKWAVHLLHKVDLWPQLIWARIDLVDRSKELVSKRQVKFNFASKGFVRKKKLPEKGPIGKTQGTNTKGGQTGGRNAAEGGSLTTGPSSKMGPSPETGPSSKTAPSPSSSTGLPADEMAPNWAEEAEQPQQQEQPQHGEEEEQQQLRQGTTPPPRPSKEQPLRPSTGATTSAVKGAIHGSLHSSHQGSHSRSSNSCSPKIHGRRQRPRPLPCQCRLRRPKNCSGYRQSGTLGGWER